MIWLRKENRKKMEVEREGEQTAVVVVAQKHKRKERGENNLPTFIDS